MMAFEHTPSQPTLDPRTIEALRTALTKSATHGNHADDLRELLCSSADEARRKGIHAEQLLITLKDLWHSLPAVAGVPQPSQTVLLQELISRCIQEYYAL